MELFCAAFDLEHSRFKSVTSSQRRRERIRRTHAKKCQTARMDILRCLSFSSFPPGLEQSVACPSIDIDEIHKVERIETQLKEQAREVEGSEPSRAWRARCGPGESIPPAPEPEAQANIHSHLLSSFSPGLERIIACPSIDLEDRHKLEHTRKHLREQTLVVTESFQTGFDEQEEPRTEEGEYCGRILAQLQSWEFIGPPSHSFVRRKKRIARPSEKGPAAAEGELTDDEDHLDLVDDLKEVDITSLIEMLHKDVGKHLANISTLNQDARKWSGNFFARRIIKCTAIQRRQGNKKDVLNWIYLICCASTPQSFLTRTSKQNVQQSMRNLRNSNSYWSWEW